MHLTAEEARSRLEEGNKRFLRDAPRAEGRDGTARAMLDKNQDPVEPIGSTQRSYISRYLSVFICIQLVSATLMLVSAFSRRIAKE